MQSTFTIFAMRTIKFLFVAILVSLTSSFAFAAASPLAVTIFPPVQFPPEDFNVTGLRLGLIGKHRDVYGLDFGLANVTTGQFVGLGVAAAMNLTYGDVTAIGAQIGGITNINYGKTNVFGVQLAVFTNYNKAESSVTGLQLSLANLADHTTIYGLQAGVYNKAREVYGFQFGLVNFAEKLHGIQIGLLNFHKQGTFVVSPIINAGF